MVRYLPILTRHCLVMVTILIPSAVLSVPSGTFTIDAEENAEGNAVEAYKPIKFSSSATDTGGWIPKTGVGINDWTVSSSQIQSEYSASEQQQHFETSPQSFSKFVNFVNPVYQSTPKGTKPVVIPIPIQMSSINPPWIRNRHVSPVRSGLKKIHYNNMRRRPPGPDFYRRSKRKSKPMPSRLLSPSHPVVMKGSRRRRITFPTPNRRFSLDNNIDNRYNRFPATDHSIKSFRFPQGESSSRLPQRSNMSPSLYLQPKQQQKNTSPLVMTHLRSNPNEPFPCAFLTESMGQNGEWCIEA